jgi:hypothetical protein
MKLRVISGISAMLVLLTLAPAQTTKVKRTADGHPDLSGIWAYAVDLPAGGIKREINGSVVIKQADLSNRRAPKGEVKGALPFTAAPVYKPEFQAKVKDLIDHESRTDPAARACRESDRRARSYNRPTRPSFCMRICRAIRIE